MLFHFPFPLPALTQTSATGNILQSSKEDESLQLAPRSASRLPLSLCSMKMLSYLCKLIARFFTAGYGYLIY